MRRVFRQRAISLHSIQPHIFRPSSLLVSRTPRPVPKTLAGQSIPRATHTIASSMATQSEMPEVSASIPKQETSVNTPAAGGGSAAEEAEAKSAAEKSNGANDADAAAEPALPPLTPAEFREFNRLADQMTFYHNHFKQSWNILYDAASTGRRPKNMTLKQFLDTGLSFVRGLTVHHDIEETYVYPMLAPKMSEFRHAQGGGGKKLSQKQSELIQQHRDIHDDYINRCRSREADLEMSVLLEKLDSWGAVLWKHMDQEVETLGAANMRKYYTLSEMRRLRM
ncbi:hypothetical protein RB595_001205 [Gaeumannomyces hyphopodioides]